MPSKLTATDRKMLLNFALIHNGEVQLREAGNGDRRWIQVLALKTRDVGHSIGFTAGFGAMGADVMPKRQQARERLDGRMAHAQEIVAKVKAAAGGPQ